MQGRQGQDVVAPHASRARLPVNPPETIESLTQRTLYRWWEKRRVEPNLPPTSALADDAVVPHLSDCVYYQVIRNPSVNFLATSNGSDVHPLFGRRVAGTLLTEHASPQLVDGILASYRAAVEARRPVYTIRNARDEHGTPVRIHILRLPLSDGGGAVDAVLSHFSAVGAAGGAFERRLLVRSGSTEDYALVTVIKSKSTNPSG
jgi:hypothetical protein